MVSSYAELEASRGLVIRPESAGKSEPVSPRWSPLDEPVETSQDHAPRARSLDARITSWIDARAELVGRHPIFAMLGALAVGALIGSKLKRRA